jgi:hypothetical protein
LRISRARNAQDWRITREREQAFGHIRDYQANRLPEFRNSRAGIVYIHIQQIAIPASMEHRADEFADFRRFRD